MVFSLPCSPKGHYVQWQPKSIKRDLSSYTGHQLWILSLKVCVWNGSHCLLLQSYNWVSEERERPADSQGRALWEPRVTGFNLSTLAHHLFFLGPIARSFHSLGPSQTILGKKKMYLGRSKQFWLKKWQIGRDIPSATFHSFLTACRVWSWQQFFPILGWISSQRLKGWKGAYVLTYMRKRSCNKAAPLKGLCFQTHSHT